MQDGLDMHGKVVIVTGGAKGVGAGITRCFLGAGAQVAVVGRTAPEQPVEHAGNEASFFQADVRDAEQITSCVEAVFTRYGRIDVLVNNAGGVAHPCAFEDLDESSRQWELALNVNGVVNCCQAVGADMLARGHGSIINISSNSSLLGEAAANVIHYGGTKGFVNSFGKALAWEWAKKGVRVNTICPGWIVPYEATDVGEGSFWNRFGFETMGKPDDMQRALQDGSLFNMSGLPIPRLGRPEDIAWLTMFLASDRASYITGQMVSVSGGAWMF